MNVDLTHLIFLTVTSTSIIIALFFGVYNWLFLKEVRKVANQQLRIVLPFFLERLLNISLLLPFLTASGLTMYLLVQEIARIA